MGYISLRLYPHSHPEQLALRVRLREDRARPTVPARPFFARTSEAARKATAEAASGAGAALEASATKLRDVRLEATLDDDGGDDDAPAPG